MADNEVIEDDDTLRSDFENAISEVEGEDAFNDDGRTPQETASDAEAESSAPQAEKTQDEISGQGEPEAAAAGDREQTYNPPLDWNIDTKEKWADLPNDVKQAINEREMAVNYLMQDTADARATHEDVGNMVNGYAAVFAAEGFGTNPLAGVQGLLNITATLQQGSSQQKAERIAGLISHYGIDIGVLDSLLSGDQTGGVDPQVTQMQQMIDQRMAPMDQLLQQANQTQYNNQFQLEQEANTSIEDFGASPDNRFFEDVRYVMADFLDMAAYNQQPMSLQEAYDRSCASNPQIANIVAQERADAHGGGGNAQRKANAASSISGRRTGGVMADGDMDMRSVMENAWDTQASG